METTTDRTAEDVPSTNRRVSADLTIGVTLLGVVIVGRLLWAFSDGSILTALGAR